MAFRQKKKTLKVTINGKEFTRTTAHNYRFVLIGRVDEEKVRQKVFNWTPDREKYLQKYWTYLTERADGSWWTKHGFPFTPQDLEQQNLEKTIVSCGIDALREEELKRGIEAYEKEKENGRFEFHVVSWHNEGRNAAAALKTAANRGYYRDLQTVEVGSEVTL